MHFKKINQDAHGRNVEFALQKSATIYNICGRDPDKYNKKFTIMLTKVRTMLV